MLYTQHYITTSFFSLKCNGLGRRPIDWLTVVIVVFGTIGQAYKLLLLRFCVLTFFSKSKKWWLFCCVSYVFSNYATHTRRSVYRPVSSGRVCQSSIQWTAYVYVHSGIIAQRCYIVGQMLDAGCSSCILMNRSAVCDRDAVSNDDRWPTTTPTSPLSASSSSS